VGQYAVLLRSIGVFWDKLLIFQVEFHHILKNILRKSELLLRAWRLALWDFLWRKLHAGDTDSKFLINAGFIRLNACVTAVVSTDVIQNATSRSILSPSIYPSYMTAFLKNYHLKLSMCFQIIADRYSFSYFTFKITVTSKIWSWYILSAIYICKFWPFLSSILVSWKYIIWTHMWAVAHFDQFLPEWLSINLVKIL